MREKASFLIMARGLSLHIGVNETDFAHYGNALDHLVACAADASEMATLADHKGFEEVRLLIDHDARLDHILVELDRLAATAKNGDLVFITFSGHGSQIPILPGSETDEGDLFDETWCVFDNQLIDTEIFQKLALFEKGVRIVFLLDSCHSGTAIHEWIHESWDFLEHFRDQKNLRFRFMNKSARNQVFNKNKADYVARQQQLTANKKIKASVCLISACQDNQRAIEDTFHGMFTNAILFEINQAHSYKSLHKAVHKHLHAFQSPNFYTLGTGVKSFIKQPFLHIK